MSYRSEYNKIYLKIDKLAKKGIDSIFDYFILIDELVKNGQYVILEDVMITKYRIDIRSFKSVYDMKNNTFDKIRRKTNPKALVSLKSTFDNANVYVNGYHVFDTGTNKYLGDIKEIENGTELEVTVGITSSILESIPLFENGITTVRFNEGNQVIYTGSIYGCSSSYTYSVTNQITPTYSTYWYQVVSPIYSLLSITDSEVSLVSKYVQGIEFLRTFTYSII